MSDNYFKKFQPELIDFLMELSENNNRKWFKANQARYEKQVLESVFAFIRAMKPRLNQISPYFLAEAKKVGGSMMRIHRDTRFSKDKTPYKTHIGIRFPHEKNRKVTSPGFYIHFSPSEVFLGIGVWRPESHSLAKIRAKIDGEANGWVKARDDRQFRGEFELGGDSLKQAPRGYPKNHPMLEDLRRKDFVGYQKLSVDDLLREGFIDHATHAFTVSRPFMHFLCDALEVPF